MRCHVCSKSDPKSDSFLLNVTAKVDFHRIIVPYVFRRSNGFDEFYRFNKINLVSVKYSMAISSKQRNERLCLIRVIRGHYWFGMRPFCRRHFQNHFIEFTKYCFLWTPYCNCLITDIILKWYIPRCWILKYFIQVVFIRFEHQMLKCDCVYVCRFVSVPTTDGVNGPFLYSGIFLMHISNNNQFVISNIRVHVRLLTDVIFMWLFHTISTTWYTVFAYHTNMV